MGRPRLFTPAGASTIMKRMRLFTGIALPEEARAEIVEALTPIRRAGAPMRWIEEDNIHLTLKFIGEAGGEQVQRIAAALPAAPRFRLRLHGFGKFPAGAGLRVFWAGVEACPPLSALFAAIEDRLAPLGIARDERPFTPHVTLGRARARAPRGGPSPFKGIESQLADAQGTVFGEWDVPAYRLYASRLTRERPYHSVLKEIPLVES